MRTSRFAHFAPYCVCASLALNTALGSDVWPELSPPSWLSYDNMAHDSSLFQRSRELTPLGISIAHRSAAQTASLV